MSYKNLHFNSGGGVFMHIAFSALHVLQKCQKVKGQKVLKVKRQKVLKGKRVKVQKVTAKK